MSWTGDARRDQVHERAPCDGSWTAGRSATLYVSTYPGRVSRPLIAVSASASRARDLLPMIADALSGDGPAVEPCEPNDTTDRRPHPTLNDVPDDVALVVRTSGSTGYPRAVMLSAPALRASAAATARRIGTTGPDQWLLALPPTHVAGLQVLVRSVLAGTAPALMDLDGGFRPAAFAAAVREMDGASRVTSLVPTQLGRLLDDVDGLAALRRLASVLLGGAATPPPLVARARAAGVRVVTTYGMSETCGGCVYDGAPLDDMQVRLEPDARILLAGPMLATGYLGRPDLDADAFVDRGGVRWLRTPDLGELTDGHLRVLGRADDMIVSGGVKVSPAAVERLLAEVPGVAEVCVVGVPDDEWGQVVTAVVVRNPGARTPSLAALRSVVAGRLGAPAAPRHVVVVDGLPARGPGKTDRRATAELAMIRLGHPERLAH